MILKTYIPAILLAFCLAGSASAKWQVVDARWRPDANAYAKRQVWQGFQWREGWHEKEQFYPKYAIPSGSIHVILKNASSAPDSISLTQVDGRALAEISTTLTKVGPVVWYRVESPKMAASAGASFETQENVPPGEWVQCDVRLRETPKKPVQLAFASKSGDKLDVPIEIKKVRVRLESVSFSPKIDRMYVYVRALDGKGVSAGSLSLDGKDLSAKTHWFAGPAGSGLALADVTFAEPLDYGTHHLLEVALPGGEKLVQPVRAWDNYFCIGLYGTVDDAHVKAAKEHGINTYMAPMNEILEKYGMNTAPGGGSTEKQRKPGVPGLVYRQNWDEPDAYDWHEGAELPLTQRLGVMAQMRVLPIQRDQRRADPTGLNLLLVDNTFKPMNWYMYGQIADVYCNDAYVMGGLQLAAVPNALESARDASTPRPLLAVLWACSMSTDANDTSPSPQQFRMQAFYALGCGAKGVSYFIDLTQKTGEGQFIGLSDRKDTWAETTSINSDLALLAPYVSVGCPIGEPKIEDKAWTRKLMCGPDNMVVIAVNATDYAEHESKKAAPPPAPAKNVTLRIPFPAHFDKSKVSVAQICGGKLAPYTVEATPDTMIIKMTELATAVAFVLTRSD